MQDNNAYSLFCKIQSAIQNNYDNMREEPECDGETHDKWEEENEAMEELINAMDEAMDAFDSAAEVRPSLKRMAIDRTR